MVLRRGLCEFDAAPLQAALQACAMAERIDPGLLDDYRQFYGLQFASIDHEHAMYVIGSGDQRISVQHFVIPDASGHVLLCHGYYDHVGLYASVIEYLLNHRISVVTFDQIGHGLSSGARVVIDSFDRYIEAVDAVRLHAEQCLDVDRWHWVGQSMGGAIVMEYLQQQPQQAAAAGEVVLFAPLVRPYGWWFARWVFAYAKLTVEQRPRRITQNAENPEFMALQHADPLQAHVLPVAWVQAMVNWFERFEQYPISTLKLRIIQGFADRTVSFRHNLKLLRQRYPNASVHTIKPARHHLVNESSSIRSDMWRWLDETCGW